MLINHLAQITYYNNMYEDVFFLQTSDTLTGAININKMLINIFIIYADFVIFNYI